MTKPFWPPVSDLIALSGRIWPPPRGHRPDQSERPAASPNAAHDPWSPAERWPPLSSALSHGLQDFRQIHLPLADQELGFDSVVCSCRNCAFSRSKSTGLVMNCAEPKDRRPQDPVLTGHPRRRHGSHERWIRIGAGNASALLSVRSRMLACLLLDHFEESVALVTQVVPVAP